MKRFFDMWIKNFKKIKIYLQQFSEENFLNIELLPLFDLLLYLQDQHNH